MKGVSFTASLLGLPRDVGVSGYEGLDLVDSI